MKKIILLCLLASQQLLYAQTTKIEAEKYTAMLGVRTQATTDSLGGINVSYIEDGDWTEYEIQPNVAGMYEFSVRIANSSSDSGVINIMSNGKQVGSIRLPITGGFQNWATASTVINLQALKQTIRLSYTNKPGKAYNVNWFSFTYIPTFQTVDLTSFVKKISLDSIRADIKIIKDSINNMPELYLKGFNGKGTALSPITNSPLKVTQAQRIAIKETWSMVIQIDGTTGKGIWCLLPAGWKKIF